MRYVYLTFVFVLVLVIGWAGFRGTLFTQPPIEVFPDMDRQPRFQPQSVTPFFADGRTDRLPPAGTVNRGMGYTSQSQPAAFRGDNLPLMTGKNADGSWVVGIPAGVVVSRELMARGQERYTIYCAVCHGQTGNGQGIISSYGWGAISNLVQTPITERADGDIFNTIVNGKNTMLAYGDRLLTPEDRWAVVLYVRALQRAHAGNPADVPAGERKALGL